MISDYIIPILIFVLLVCATIKKGEKPYKSFVEGAKQSLPLVFDIFAYITAVFVFIEIFDKSGLSNYLATALSPIFNFLGIPTELTKLVVLKPFSGSGGLALLQDIFDTYGVDSYIGRCASVILASSDTVFYVSTVYFSKTSVKKLGIAIPIALFATFLSVILSCLFCRII
jgi:spore maturation protein B